MSQSIKETIISYLKNNKPKSFYEIFDYLNSNSNNRITENTFKIRLHELKKDSIVIRKTKKHLFSLNPSITEELISEKLKTNSYSRKNTNKSSGSNRKSRRSAEDDFFYIVKKYKYKNEFPSKIDKELSGFSKDYLSIEQKRRTSFEDQLVITIDGEDAKDLDDAVSLTVKNDGYVLSVHIADVSYYVKEGSTVDKEAFKRGNSVYLVDKVIPMLPPKLSNDLCSLNEKTIKLTLSCVINLDIDGNIIDYSFFESFIKSAKRCTYEEIDNILSYPSIENCKPEEKKIYPMIMAMKNLAMILYRKRVDEGSIDFLASDLKIITDKRSKPVDVKRIEQTISRRIIEEFMLTANRATATFLSKYGDSIYRIHPSPDQEKILDANRMISRFGFNIKTEPKIIPQSFSAIIENIKDKQYSKFINLILLKSMKQASYDTDNIGHFGLGFDLYTHFTSPIRRYPDLLVHRLIKKAMHFQDSSKQILNLKYLQDACSNSSQQERLAMEAERELVKIKSVRFMEDKIGQTFDGIITGVFEFGIFVEIQPYGIDGLVKIETLGGSYQYDEKSYSLISNIAKTYQLGDEIKVTVVVVDLRRCFLDLLIDGLPKHFNKPRKRKDKVKNIGKNKRRNKRSYK